MLLGSGIGMRAGLARHTRRQGLSISRRSTHLKSFIYGAVDRAYPPAAKSTVELAIPDGEEWFAWNDEAKHDSIGDSTIPYGLDSKVASYSLQSFCYSQNSKPFNYCPDRFATTLDLFQHFIVE